MRKTTSWAEWLLAIGAIFVLTITLLVLLYGVSDTSNNYQRLAAEYEKLRIATENQYNYFIDLVSTAQGIELPPKPTSTDVPPNTFVTITQFAGITLWLVAFVSLIGTIVISSFKRKKMTADFKRRIDRARELGHAEGLREVVQGLVHDRDVLADVVDWLQKYRNGKATVDDAAKVHGQILERLVKQAKLAPVGQLGQTVQFDPKTYATLEELSLGESGEIIEVGWKVSHEIVKKPVVGKRRR